MAAKLFSACFGRKGCRKDSSDNAAKVHTANAQDPASGEEQRKGGSVLVELFTSQGCATSPEAELLISRLGRGELPDDAPPVIILAYHVEYWDYLGWKDPFGSMLWTARQKAYVEALQQDTIYTPQVVVQGRAECFGTNEEALLAEISKAQQFSGPTMQATFERKTPETLQVSLSGALRTKVDGKGMDIMVALYENGLVTEVSSGENKGQVMKNDFVVRVLEKMCTVRDVSAKKTVSGTVNFNLWDGFDSSKCGIVVFLQNPSMQNFGCQQFQLPDDL
ncbi:uncharacterized protein LOC116244995 [Nymphaea colorata]|nr:uncharacterized protein LOC116244995 [Nymphaea colorata]